MPFVHDPLLLGVLLAVNGLAIAPALIAEVSVVQTSVSALRLTEALGWSSTGLAGGVSIGAAVAGAVVDRFGSVGGFTTVAGFGVLLVLGVLLVRPTPAPLVAQALR
jgi:hypothetical protein